MSAENIQPREFDVNKHWRDQTNCANVDTELFFPAGSTSPEDKKQTLEAKQKCVTCIAKVACYEFSKQILASDGIYGGLTKAQRRVRFRQKKKLTDSDLVKIINKDIKALAPVYTEGI